MRQPSHFPHSTRIVVWGLLITSLTVGMLLLPTNPASSTDLPEAATAPASALPRIVGGVEVDPPGKYPFMAAIVWRGSDSFNGQFCGGSVISSDWVMTAAHCLVGETASTIDVVIGRHDLSSAAGERIRAAQIIRHPGYNSNTNANDIALIRLAKPTSYTPIALPADASFEAAGTVLTVTGWGTTRHDPPQWPYQLREVSLPVVGDAACLAAYAGYANPPAALMLCAGAAGMDSCQGDSGGPLFAATTNGFTQVGIVSSGEGCGLPGFPGMYASVAALTTWITDQTGVSPPPTVSATCLGVPASMVGTEAADTLNGTAGADVIVGLGGNDTINGLGGNDRICGGDGNDSIDGGDGDDQVHGGAGNDLILGSAGTDVLVGANGDDNLQGGTGDDTLSGEAGNDTLDGGDGTDTVAGGEGTDTCYGETQQTCELPAAPPPPVSELKCLGMAPTIVGTAVGETINGTNGADVIVGLGGNDIINGYGGDDRICGGGGADTISPGPGNDRVQGGAGNDTIAGGIGADILKGGAGADNIRGNEGSDKLFGGKGDDTLDGGDGTDTVTGGPGTDFCQGETQTTCETGRGAAGDTKAPELATFGLSPKTVNGSAGPVDIVFAAALRDDLSGLAPTPTGSPTQVRFVGLPGLFFDVIFAKYSKVSGTSPDATYRYAVTLPRYSAAGA